MGLLHGALLRASGRAEVVGIVDPSRAARLIIRGAGLGVNTFASLDAALARDDKFAGVFICTPPRAPEAISERALPAGLHPFVE